MGIRPAQYIHILSHKKDEAVSGGCSKNNKNLVYIASYRSTYACMPYAMIGHHIFEMCGSEALTKVFKLQGKRE